MTLHRASTVAARRAGAAIDPHGIPLEQALALIEQGKPLGSLSARPAPPAMPGTVNCGSDCVTS